MSTTSHAPAKSGKKRKRELDGQSKYEIDTSKPTAVFTPSEGRSYTLSVALPGSIIANAQSPELKIALAGQIARALAVFCVDEVVIFDDGQVEKTSKSHGTDFGYIHEVGRDSYTGYSDPNYFLMHILSYLETPPHLRKHLFPMHPNLKLAGTTPSLDMPHHLRAHEWCQYREGVTIKTPQPSNGGTKAAEGQGGNRKSRKSDAEASPVVTYVESGLPHRVSVSTSIPPNTRVTLKFSDDKGSSDIANPALTATAVAPTTPREEAGYYWGYGVRSASSISALLTECPFDGGYDLTFGTSERGIPITTLRQSSSGHSSVPEFYHMLIAFGGVAGLEVAVKGDAELTAMGVSEPKSLFDYWVDLCPGQGSRTIRTEEAIWLGLMGLRDVVVTKGRR